jgi:hypothetical protein
MKYSCNACGMYVDAGSGHDCYKPLPDNAPRVLQSVADEWKRRAERAEAEHERVKAMDRADFIEEHEARLKAEAELERFARDRDFRSGEYDVLLAHANELERENAALRQRHAAAVEQAYIEGWNHHGVKRLSGTRNAAWLASAAKAALEGS